MWEYNPIPYWNNYIKWNRANYLTSPNNTDFDIGLNGLTVSMWVNPVTALTDFDILYKNISGFGYRQVAVSIKTSYAVRFFYTNICGKTIIGSGNNAIVVNKWQYITVVFNRITGIKLYVNNVETSGIFNKYGR